MNWLRCHLAVLIPALFWVRLEAQSTQSTIQTNVDIEEPTVIRSPATTDREDGFGWSAVFHEVDSEMRVIIGAPRGTFPGGLMDVEDFGNPRVDETGLVYNCGVQGGPSPVCVGVRGDISLYSPPTASNNSIDAKGAFDGREIFPDALSEGRLFDQQPNALLLVEATEIQFERKQGQLMGSTLVSTGQNLMACAPLWTNGLPAQGNPRGLCFIGDQALRNFRTLFPCSVSPNADEEDNCIAGISANIVVDTPNDHIVIGAPGRVRSPGAFLGGIYTHIVDTMDFPEFTSYVPPITNPQAAQHAGFQLANGYISSNDRTGGPTDVIFSIPRSDGLNNYNGAASVFPSSELDDIAALSISQTVRGNQTAEFFGYSLATADLNGDGFDELLVGAPMFSALDPLVAEKGRVYVHFNDGSGSLNPVPVILEPERLPAFSRFGFAVTNAGDLDEDGREDVVVGAPYESLLPSTDTSTGAVYVYYGKSTEADFASQVPQRITASNITDSVSDLSELKTFGFSLDGNNVDVDGNSHTDFLVGAPDGQAVVLLRTLPFVNVTVEIDDFQNVTLTESFDIDITAMYSSASVTGSLAVTFDLTDAGGRVVFAGGSTRMFMFQNPGVPVVVSIRASPATLSSVIDPYQFQLNLVDIERNLAPVPGSQELSDLSQFPRLRLFGNSSFEVSIQDPCEIDGRAGCSSDIDLSISPTQQTLVAPGSGMDSSSVVFDVTYSNMGREDSLEPMLRINNLPSTIFSGYDFLLANIICSPLEIDRDMPLVNVSCNLQQRLRPRQTFSTQLILFLSSAIVGNEAPLDITMEIVQNSEVPNEDQDPSNNVQLIRFTLDSVADIGMDMSFSPPTLEYQAESPSGGTSRAGARELGEEIGSLQVRVNNSGPSDIQNARMVINFPSRLPDVTGANFFLYPYTLSTGADVIANCSLGILDPEGLEAAPPQLITGRRRRSISSANPISQRLRGLAGVGARRKRQASPDLTLDCGGISCDVITCDIETLTTGNINFFLGFVVDERFFSSEAASRVFRVRATGSVTITSEFQVADDNTVNNTASATAILMPQSAEEGPDNLVHFIVWPIIGTLLILIVLVVLLYFVGFFRRKKKPGEEDEIEGDANIPPAPGAENKEPVKQLAEEATTV